MAERTQSSRPGWRDVYDLVRDTREDVLGAVATVDDKVDTLATRVSTIELAAAQRRSEKVGEARILGIGKSTLAILVATAGAVVSAGASLKLF